MSKLSLTHSQKKRIRRRVNKRNEQLPDRLDDITKGESIPKKDQQRLNEPKQYELAMVFLDIDGYSEYVFKNSDIGVLYMLGILMPEMMKLVSEHGGYFEKNTGDGLLAYFGFGKGPTEAISDLFSYYSTVQWALNNEINPLLEDQGLDAVSISGGATFGRVFLTRIGERDLTQDLDRLTGVSNFANVANRIEAMAEAGEFLVGPNVNYYADDRFNHLIKPSKHMIPHIKWENPSSNRKEIFQIYEYRGTWEDIDGATHGDEQ